MVLGHQQMVERAVNALEEQAHVAAVIRFLHGTHRIKQARRGPRVVTRKLAEVGHRVHGRAPHMRNTPNRVSSMGALRVADSPSASTRRVSAGSITPSSHRRAVA